MKKRIPWFSLPTPEKEKEEKKENISEIFCSQADRWVGDALSSTRGEVKPGTKMCQSEELSCHRGREYLLKNLFSSKPNTCPEVFVPSERARLKVNQEQENKEVYQPDHNGEQQRPGPPSKTNRGSSGGGARGDRGVRYEAKRAPQQTATEINMTQPGSAVLA